jgi:outer membrane protein assembly factor BamB
VTDGQIVVFFYGNGTLAAFELDGKPLWKRNIQKDYGDFAFLWTFSSSPLLYDGKLYLQVLQRDVPVQRGFGFRGPDRSTGGPAIESYLLAMDPRTGETLWKHVRPSQAVMESREAFSSPIPFEHGGRREILIAGGDDITGHNPENGEELWRWGTWNPQRIGHWRLVPSPVAGDGIILACAPKKDPIYALKAGGEGNLTDDAVAWISDEVREVASDVPTPAFYDGDFFILNDLRHQLSRVEPKTGKVKWSLETPGRRKYEASPLAADGKIYLVNFDGLVIVVSAEEGKILNTVSMAEPSENPVRSTICAAHGNLFIRTNNKLYCIGQ